MNETILRLLLHIHGRKIYELQVGFATMFSLCADAQVFSEDQFHRQRKQLEKLPEFQKLREVVDSLGTPKTDEALEKLLREYEGTIQ